MCMECVTLGSLLLGGFLRWRLVKAYFVGLLKHAR